jgi:hypothetical protein
MIVKNTAIAVLFMVGVGGAAGAAAPETLAADVGNCAVLTDSKIRLACYDGLAAQLKAASAPAAQTGKGDWYNPVSWFGKDAPPSAGGTAADFGTESIAKPEAPVKAAEISRIAATIAKIDYSTIGRFIVTLDNGQVWRQIEGDSTRLRSSAFGAKITISRGLFGTFNLVIDDSKALYKVMRVQ